MDRSSRRRARVLLIGMLALLLGACSPGASPAATPAPTSVAGLRPTPRPRPTDPPPPTPAPTEDPREANPPPTPQPEAALAPTEGPSEANAPPTPQPEAALAPTVTGETVLTFGRGAGDGNIGANATFRIGADGSIRVLDSDNRRLLFYDAAGALRREQPLAEANSPLDFIVANSGEIFVLDFGGDGANQNGPVLRYAADGTLAERIAVGQNVVGAALMLNSQNYLFVVNGVESHTLIQHDGVAVPAATQPFTAHRGGITPRSPVAFISEYDNPNNVSKVSVLNVTATNSPQRILIAPAGQHFFNIDRAMNVYTTSSLDVPLTAMTTQRYSPAGELLGAAHIDLAGCDMERQADRRFYIDQAGAAWTLCITPAGATISRYSLLDAGGQPLPAAASEPADVSWRPGGKFTPG
jgi:hypothetical protein